MMLRRPLLSVIVPAFGNLDVFIAAISSLELQEIADWELIVLECGLEPDQLKLLGSYLLNDCRIRLLSCKNLNYAKALNQLQGLNLLFVKADTQVSAQQFELYLRLSLLQRKADDSLINFLIEENPTVSDDIQENKVLPFKLNGSPRAA